MKNFLLFVALLIPACLLASGKSGDDEYYRTRFRQFQLLAIAYSSNSDTIYVEAHRLMPELKRKGYEVLYFSVWNMYIQQLYYNEQFVKAQSELRDMMIESRSVANHEALSQIYCARGMLELHFGQFRAAEATLRQGLVECPPLDQCRYPRCRLSLYRWLTQAFISDRSHLSEALKLCDMQEQALRKVVEQQRGDEYHRDKVCIMAQKSQVMTLMKRMKEAGDLLDNADKFISPTVSPTIYLQYYDARLLFASAMHDYQQALHIAAYLTQHFSHGYRPIESRYLRMQADLLMLMGHTQEAAKVYQHFASLSDSVNRVRVANDLKETEMQYKTHLLRLQTSRMKARIIIYAVVVVFLGLLLCISLRFYYRLRRKNGVLIARLEELRLKEKNDNDETEETENKSLMERLQTYLDDEVHLSDSGLQMKQVAEDLNTSLTSLQRAVHEELDLTLRDYLTGRRLALARKLLTQGSDVPVQQIAEKCGFKSVRTFQRQFSSAYALSPTSYRHIYQDVAC